MMRKRKEREINGSIDEGNVREVFFETTARVFLKQSDDSFSFFFVKEKGKKKKKKKKKSKRKETKVGSRTGTTRGRKGEDTRKRANERKSTWMS